MNKSVPTEKQSVGDPALRSAVPLRFFGNTSTIEISPIFIALNQQNPALVSVTWGGIWDIISGKADVATNGETQLLRYSVQDPDLRVILTVAEDGYRLAARKSAGIHCLADLRGKRVTTPLDTTAHWFLLELLRSEGLSESDVVLVPIVPWDRQIEALVKGDVDAMAMWEPDPQIAKEALGDDILLIHGHKDCYRELFNLYTSKTILSDPVRRAEVVNFVASIIAASKTLTQNPLAYFPLIAKSTGNLERHVVAAWSGFGFPAKIADNLLDVLVQQELWISNRQQRNARSRADLATLIDADVYRDALLLSS